MNCLIEDGPCYYVQSAFILPPPPDTDPDGVELQHVAQALRGAFVWATAVALTAFVAIGYLLATL